MPETSNLSLPLLEASQAQKHVTVNEALLGLDALSQLVLTSVRDTVPPVAPPDGAVYAIPVGAQAPWSNFVGRLATFVNGGWVYFTPKPGWRAWLSEEEQEAVFDGFGWRALGSGSTPSGAATDLTPIEFTHVVTPGPVSVPNVVIPAGAVVIGITGRVVSEITGSLLSWRLGVVESDNRYGSGLGVAQNSFVRGLTGSPLTYYSDTPLQMSAEGGSFAGGQVTFVLHLMQLQLPDPV